MCSPCGLAFYILRYDKRIKTHETTFRLKKVVYLWLWCRAEKNEIFLYGVVSLATLIR